MTRRTPRPVRIGERYGSWKIIARIERRGYYRCRCDCGRTQDVAIGNLRHGFTRQCNECRLECCKARREHSRRRIAVKCPSCGKSRKIMASTYREQGETRCQSCASTEAARKYGARHFQATGRTLQEWGDLLGITREAVRMRIKNTGSPYGRGGAA